MKKRLLALGLCLCLCLSLFSAAGAADVTYFPEFSESVEGAMKPDKEWPAIGSSTVPTQSYFGQTDDWETCKKLAKDYIDLLVGTGDFTVVNPFKVVYGKEGGEDVHYSADLRYTGSAPMNGTLKAMRASGTWPDYGEYHITVRAERDASRPSAARRNSIVVRWDKALRPEGIDKAASTPSNGSGSTTTAPSNGSGSTTTTPSNDPGSTVTTPSNDQSDEPSDTTVVLAIGYNKMCVARTVSQVDSQNANVYPVAENGRTLVPVSRIVEAFGGQSTWNSKTNNTTYTLGNRKVEHVIGSKDVLIQRGSQVQKKTMEAASKAMNNRTYVPVRYVLEGLGLWVGYEPTYQLVVVSTANLTGKNLIKLPETQRLFDSEEVPETPRKTMERYTTDGLNYTMEVGEALTLFNSYKSSGTYYAYTWDVLEGGELVKVDRKEATCKFYAKRPGVVTIQSHVDETWVLGLGSFRNNTRTYTMTITITPATNSGSSGGLMTWQTCRTCNGTGKIRVGTRQETCPTCLGQKMVLQ